MAAVWAAHTVNMNNEAVRSAKRSGAQIDALWKARCPDTYKSPEDGEEMTTFINSPIISDKSAAEILSTISNAEAGNQTQKPGWLQRLLPWLLLLAIASALGASLLTWSLWPKNSGDIEALPYVPPPAQGTTNGM